MNALVPSDLPSAAAQLADLSRDEREVLGLLAEGLASREIAERLEVTESTVYHVVAALLDAVGSRSRIDRRTLSEEPACLLNGRLRGGALWRGRSRLPATP